MDSSGGDEEIALKAVVFEALKAEGVPELSEEIPFLFSVPLDARDARQPGAVASAACNNCCASRKTLSQTVGSWMLEAVSDFLERAPSAEVARMDFSKVAVGDAPPPFRRKVAEESLRSAPPWRVCGLNEFLESKKSAAAAEQGQAVSEAGSSSAATHLPSPPRLGVVSADAALTVLRGLVQLEGGRWSSAQEAVQLLIAQSQTALPRRGFACALFLLGAALRLEREAKGVAAQAAQQSAKSAAARGAESAFSFDKEAFSRGTTERVLLGTRLHKARFRASLLEALPELPVLQAALGLAVLASVRPQPAPRDCRRLQRGL